MIELSNISKTYSMGGTPVYALRDVSLQIEQGDYVAIMGSSGSGKSTLMHVIGLLDSPDSGSYHFKKCNVSGLADNELALLRSAEFGFIFQQFHLLARTSALKNVALPLLYAQRKLSAQSPEKLLADVGLSDRTLHTPSELSGGQQQRVAIARALINQPSVLLADEPTGNLDSASEKEILDLFSELNDSGITVVIVTHEEEVARRTKRIIRMRDGSVLSDERLAPISTASIKRFPDSPNRNVDAMPKSFGESVSRAWAHLREAFRALSGNKIRTALSMLGILVGVAAVVAVVAIGTGAKQSVEEQLSSLGSNLLTVRPGSAKVRGVALEVGSFTRFTVNDSRDIEQNVPFVVDVAPSVSGRGQVAFGNKNWSTLLLGTTPSYERMRALTPVVGRFFTPEEERGRTKVALIGETIRKELFQNTNPVGQSIKVNRVSFRIIGLLPEKGATHWRDQDDVVIIPLSTAMRRMLGKDYLDSIDVQIAHPTAIESARSGISDLLMKNHKLSGDPDDSFQIRNMAEIQDAMASTSRTMSLLLSIIAGVSLLVGGIGIMNIMLVSVTERTKEIGLRKALGATKSDILWQFLVEAVVISLLGGVAGIAIAWGISQGVSHFAGWAVIISLNAVLLAVMFSAAIGVLFGLAPAWKASRLHPIQALRFE